MAASAARWPTTSCRPWSRLLNRDAPPDHIVIETSGLALPKPLVRAFAWPEMRTRMTVDGVIAVVDGPAAAAGRFADDPAAVARQRAADPALDHDNPLAELFEDQLACADLVVLNKTDLIPTPDLAALRGAIELQLRPGVKLVRPCDGRVAPEVALGLAAAAEDDLASRPSAHDLETGHDHDDFESFVVTRGSVEDGDAFLRGSRRVGSHDMLRVKGFVDMPGRDRRQVVQAVGDRLQQYFDRAWHAGETRETRLVVIGLKGLDRSAISVSPRRIGRLNAPSRDATWDDCRWFGRGRSRPDPRRHRRAVERRHRDRAARGGAETAAGARSGGAELAARADPAARP